MKYDINILIADDDPEVVKSSCRMLNNEGYSAEGVLSGDMAMDRMERNDYDLVLTDLAMPGMDSIYLIKWIRQHRPGTGIVTMADCMMRETIREAHKLGIISHMRKPFTPALLKEMTSMALELIEIRASGEEPEDEFPPAVLEELDEAIYRCWKESGNINRVLLDAQKVLGYLPSSIQERIAQALDINPSEVRRIVLSYPCFTTKPWGGDTSYFSGSGRAWRGVPWKTGRRVIAAVNEYIRTREAEKAGG